MEIFHQIKSDPLRTFLSLFGVSVGIFVVVVSFALVDAFKRAVVAGFDHFGSDMIMVERFPVVEEEGEDADWSRYALRPQPSREDYLAIIAHYLADSNSKPHPKPQSGWTAYAGSAEADVVYGGKIMRGCKLVGVCGAWQRLIYSSVCQGRDFSSAESAGSDTKVIIGAKIAEQLFGEAPCCGSSVRIGGRNMTVIGVLSREGKNIINLYAADYALFVPISTAERIAGSDALETMIAVGPGDAGREATIGEMRRLLRASRRLTPAQEDNFALNTMDDLCRQTVALTRKITILGLVVALFSLLIGGFGIVNILFVSVSERTWEIGLKKALGARRKSILNEFLLEALMLSVLGAAAGLLLAWGAVSLIPAGVIDATVTPNHILIAFVLAVVLGLTSGLAPAAQASRLNPVDALRR